MKEVYNETVEEIYKRLDTGLDGLTVREAESRLEKYGENKLKEKKKESNIKLFLSQFNDFMIILLIFASLISALISYIEKESYVDSIIIIIIVIINAILSFLEEKKASDAIDELNNMFVSNTCVIRDSKKYSIDVKDVVVGDIIELETGDYICADCRIISSDFLEVNESTLTGESISIKKDCKDISGARELYERTNMVFAGCTVSAGHAKVLVVSTGMDTELGKIAGSLIDNKKDITPLEKKVNEISKVLTYIIIGIIILMMIIGLIKHNDFFDVLMISISLAVAAIPEGMSSVITIILSIGMSDMARKNVIIRKMSSVETLGSTDIICSDKTGTITENKMIVKSIYINNMLYADEDQIEDMEILKMCASSNHNVSVNGDKYIGDETEVAIVKYLERFDNYEIERIKEYPFDSDRKMMSTVSVIDGNTYSFTKGSLDSIINKCNKYLVNGKTHKMTAEYKKKIFEIEKKESEKSLRILAFAYKDKEIDNVEENMIFIGLIGMMDPPRASVYDSIKKCVKAGIRPVMITGDSINTASAIAKSVGIIKDDSKECKAIEGKYIEKMTDEELMDTVLKYQVYARITPSSKLRIVDALQKHGYVVAMTGDGVNDAPAIQKADIGIGMGITGTEVVKKVADCILVDDSFSTIVDGVEEGRRITSNIRKVMLYLLAGNIVEVILVFVSMLLNMEMFTTLQLLWINLVTDSIPAVMLAFEKPDKDVMEKTKKSTSFFTPFLTSKIVISAIFKSIIMIFLFIYYVKTKDIGVASSLMFIYLIGNELLYAFSCRDLKHSVINKDILSNRKLTIGIGIIVLIQIIILTTGLSKYFIVSGICANDVIFILFICFIVFIIGELLKPLYAKLFKDYMEAK